jgi:2-polyprenyl-6-hydroxyphenyl methylase/3-demethylubiquinone-9 3-methyltransferase
VVSEVASQVRPGGLVVIANCFHPVTKCHLPDTFHLRFTFQFFARLIGLQHLGPCEGTYARRYRKRAPTPVPWRTFRYLEILSRRAHQAISPLLTLTKRKASP